MKKMESDVIVVAAGPAGLSASITAAEASLKVITFEKSNTTGGAGNMGMGPLGLETRIQKEALIPITKEEAFLKHMEYTHYRVDGELVNRYFRKSADTIAWLEDMGVEFLGSFKYFPESEQTWHIVKPENGIPGPRAASAMYKIMTNKAKELGVDILVETPVTDLIVENGKVCGVIAKDKNGETIEARAKAVVVATGGFGDNADMIKEYFDFTCGEDFFPFMIPGLKGDGLNMCWKAGAQKSDLNVEIIYQLPDNLNWMVLDGVMRQPNLLINQRGKRFMNEGKLSNTTFSGNAILQQPGRYAYAIMDENIKKQYQREGLDLVSMVHSPSVINDIDEAITRAKNEAYPYFFEADTVAQLADQLGIDETTLQDTLDDYNDICDENIDDQFGKESRYLRPIGRGKLYAAKFYLGAYGSLGGLLVNSRCQVYDNDLNPIPGLYGAGTDANTIYGDSYNFYLPGNSMGFAINSGRIASESIADDIDDL